MQNKIVKCAFVTKQHGVFAGQDDGPLASVLASRGWEIEAIDWKDPTLRWDTFDVALIRSPWDYYYHPKEFLAALESIHRSGCLLIQDIDVVRRNIDKRYLDSWQSKGFPIIPTQYFYPFDSAAAQHVRDIISSTGRKWVLKPTISAGSVNTFLVGSNTPNEHWRTLCEQLTRHHVMLQPFLENVQIEGEISLVFLGGNYHHTILKTPAAGDFRVQVQHGGIYKRVEPDPWLVDASLALLRHADENTLYSRLDWVRGDENVSSFPYLLMECEQIEPDLYLRFTADGFETYANLLAQRVEKAATKS